MRPTHYILLSSIKIWYENVRVTDHVWLQKIGLLILPKKLKSVELKEDGYLCIFFRLFISFILVNKNPIYGNSSQNVTFREIQGKFIILAFFLFL